MINNLQNIIQNNIHNEYIENPPDFFELTKINPELEKYLIKYESNNKYSYTIDYKNSDALLELDKAILKRDFNIEYYYIPNGYLLPTIPSRLNYILIIKELEKNFINNNEIKIVDIGTGSNIIYPIIGNKKFGYKFLCSEINEDAYKNAYEIINKNNLNDSITIKIQKDENKIFDSIINLNEKYSFSICNPPYFDYLTEVKIDNKHTDNQFNFNEVYYKGGELEFINKMFNESIFYKNNIFIFTSLIGKYSNFKLLKQQFENNNNIKIFFNFYISQGKNRRWILCWSFYNNYNEYLSQNNSFLFNNSFLKYVPIIK